MRPFREVEPSAVDVEKQGDRLVACGCKATRRLVPLAIVFALFVVLHSVLHCDLTLVPDLARTAIAAPPAVKPGRRVGGRHSEETPATDSEVMLRRAKGIRTALRPRICAAEPDFAES